VGEDVFRCRLERVALEVAPYSLERVAFLGAEVVVEKTFGFFSFVIQETGHF